MDLIAIDDSSQKEPRRDGMRRLVAVGAAFVPGDRTVSLERTLTNSCGLHGFPEREEFKWSPSREQWMRKGLTEERRTNFFKDCLRVALEHGVQAAVVIEDTESRPATDHRMSPEEDVTSMLLERANLYLAEVDRTGIVMADRPSGGRKNENRFVSGCLDTIQSGTDYVKFDRIAHVTTADSGHARALQLADVITGCTLALVSGAGSRFHPGLFDSHVRPLLRQNRQGGIGGTGVKIHPDGRYLNLYHWLFGDRTAKSRRLPIGSLGYGQSPDSYSDPKTEVTRRVWFDQSKGVTSRDAA